MLAITAQHLGRDALVSLICCLSSSAMTWNLERFSSGLYVTPRLGQNAQPLVPVISRLNV